MQCAKKLAAEKIGLPMVRHHQDLFVYGTTNQSSVSIGHKIACSVNIDSINEEVDILIADDKAQMYDVIIGRTLTDILNVKLIKTNEGIQFRYHDEWPFSEMELANQPVEETLEVLIGT